MNQILEIKFGSHLYGTNTEESDLDLKGIYLPTSREIVLGTYKPTISTTRPKRKFERNTKDDVDIEVFSLDRYLQLLSQGQTVALDAFFSPEFQSSFVRSDPAGRFIGEIVANKDRLLHKNISSFLGYAKMQAARYGIKGSRMDALKRAVDLLSQFHPHSKLSEHAEAIAQLRTDNLAVVSLENTPIIDIVLIKCPDGAMLPHLEVANRKVAYTAKVKHALDIYRKVYDEYGSRAHKANLAGGRDYKALSHAVRVNSQAKELLLTGNIIFPRPDRQILLDIKTQKMPYEQIAELIEQGLVDVVEAQKKSTLRDASDQEWIDNFVYDVYSEIIKKG